MRFIPFFMIFWVIVNVSVCIQPIEALPSMYRCGYGALCYNISRAARCVVFTDKNQLSQNFGILFAWMAVAVVSLAVIQWAVRQRGIKAYEEQSHTGTGGMGRRNRF